MKFRQAEPWESILMALFWNRAAAEEASGENLEPARLWIPYAEIEVDHVVDLVARKLAEVFDPSGTVPLLWWCSASGEIASRSEYSPEDPLEDFSGFERVVLTSSGERIAEELFEWARASSRRINIEQKWIRETLKTLDEKGGES